MDDRDRAYISLFSGAGGMDIGLEMAGWRTAYATDNDPFAVETLRKNAGIKIDRDRRAFEGTHIEQADIRHLDADIILKRSGLAKGDIPLVSGGPPCQSWSSAGHQLGFRDPRGRLFDDFVRVANGLDARWLLLENVRGLLTARGPDGQPGSALTHIRLNLLRAGFQTTVALLNSADFGVPQRRVRLFIIGFRAGDAPPFPLPSHSKVQGPDNLPRWLALGHAVASVASLHPGEIIRPTGKLAVELAEVAPGGGLKSPGKSERTRPGGHWGYKQGAFVADLEQSARTVTANAQQDWIRDPVLGLRRLCPRECAAIQSFPGQWVFRGNAAVQYRLIGNAVPPLLAKAIGEALLRHIHIEDVPSSPDLAEPLPLPSLLAYHVQYTLKEEVSNGQSRREAPRRRNSRLAKAFVDVELA